MNALRIDVREAKLHIPLVQSLRTSLTNVPIIDTEMMKFGDYAWDGKLGDQTVRIGLELSSVSDVIGKLNNNRFDYQMTGLLGEYDIRILMISGSYLPDRDGYVVVHGAPRTMKYKRFANSLFSAQMHGIVVDNVPSGTLNVAERIAQHYTYWQKDTHTSFRGLSATARAVSETGEDIDGVFIPTGAAVDKQVQALMMWPTIGEDKARNALQFAGSVRALSMLGKEALRQIPGWGPATAATVDDFLSAVPTWRKVDG
jgi:ERCC4-type nuclease